MTYFVKTGLALVIVVGWFLGCTDEPNDSDGDTENPPCDSTWGAHSEKEGLCWQNPPAPENYLLGEALDYCDNLELGGHTDWTLPSQINYMRLLGRCETGFNSTYGGRCDSCQKSDGCVALFVDDIRVYWTSTPDGVDEEEFWTVDLEFGKFSPEDANVDNHVRCVRVVK